MFVLTSGRKKTATELNKIFSVVDRIFLILTFIRAIFIVYDVILNNLSYRRYSSDVIFI